MSDDSPAPDSDERILLRFEEELRKRGPEVEEEYAREYPHLAEEFRALVEMSGLLAAARRPEQLGEFRIVREIARGGMGVIYEAEDDRLKRRVAVKTIKQGRGSPAARERFLREQEILAQLHQTHIVPIHVAGEEAGLQYFVMPYIQGVSLHRVVEVVGRLGSGDSGSRTPSLGELVGLASQARDNNQPNQPGAQATGEADPSHALRAGSSTACVTKLSRRYFRSVATILADVADAIHHAHAAGIVHRDLKPSNVMVDAQEQCWIIDFGLGRYLSEAAVGGEASVAASGVMGTAQYAAPEQLQGMADARSDTWALGVTLYELLALRRAFDGATPAKVVEQVLTHEPESPRTWIRNVPEDLVAVCCKAMRKEATERYATAGAMAEDLRRWLRGEAVEARGRQPVRRVGLWARRNKGWAAALVVGTMALVSIVLGVLVFQRQQLRYLEREARHQQIQQVLQDNRRAGWSTEVWNLVKHVASSGTDQHLQALASASLAGFDAHLTYSFAGLEASSVAFDADGKRLLFGGLEKVPARLWSGVGIETRASGCVGLGPVAFTEDGTPLQLVVDPDRRGKLHLWDVAKQRLMRALLMPDGDEIEDRDRRPPRLLLSQKGRSAAAAGAKHVAVWKVDSGKQTCTIPLAATALAVTPDGTLLAAGRRDGSITVFHLPSGEVAVQLPGVGTEVTCLTFYPDVCRDPERSVSGWGLVAGDFAAGVVVWDLERRQPRVFCRGSDFRIEALAVSSDGMTLASACNADIFLWDLATGKPVLRTSAVDLVLALMFSPDGKRLAAASRAIWDSRPRDGKLWTLEQGRGIRVFRGLSTPTSKVCLSQDGKRLAVLDRAWRIGIWDVPSGRLQHLLAVPPGLSPENAALRFGQDDSFAFAAGKHARLYKLLANTVELKAQWGLETGLVDRFAAPRPDQLLLVRHEAKAGRWGPPNIHPRTVRIWELSPSERTPRLRAVIPDFTNRLYCARVTSDGSVYLATGSAGPDGEKKILAAYELPSGKRIWDSDDPPKGASADLISDPEANAFLWPEEETPPRPQGLVDVRTGRTIGPTGIGLRKYGAMLSGGGERLLVRLADGDSRNGGSIALQRVGSLTPLLRVQHQAQIVLSEGCFSQDGGTLVWGNYDGTVAVCDLAEVRRRLGQLNLGWDD